MESWKILFLMEVVTLIKKSIENRVFYVYPYRS